MSSLNGIEGGGFHAGEELNGTESMSRSRQVVQMVGSNPTISDHLSLQIKILLELGCTEGLVVRMKALELDTVFMSKFLKGMFPL